MENKIAVSCPTEDEGVSVGKKMNKKFGEDYNWDRYGEDTCLAGDSILINFCSKEYYEREDYTILSAADYLAYGLGGKPEFKIGDTVKSIDSTCPYVGQEAKIQGYFPEEAHPYQLIIGDRIIGSYLNQELELVKGRAFEVGDRVEVIGSDVCGDYEQPKGSICVVTKKIVTPSYDMHNNGKLRTCIEGENSGSVYWDTSLKLVPKEKEHTVPLRVDDRVRVLESAGKRSGAKGKLVDGYKGNFDHLVLISDGLDGYKEPFSKKDLELIPTEKDITVGSVWECIETNSYMFKGDIRTVKDIDGTSIVNKENGLGLDFHSLLKDFKLIHRGDEEAEAWIRALDMLAETNDILSDMPTYDYRSDPRFGEAITEQPKQTNKKEKKMKTKVIKEGLEIIDTVCDNIGKVAYYNEETGKVAYEEANGELTIGHIDNMNVSPVKVIMPNPKPVKGKKKKGR